MQGKFPPSPLSRFAPWVIGSLYLLDILGGYLLGAQAWTWPQVLLAVLALSLSTWVGLRLLWGFWRQSQEPPLPLDGQARWLEDMQDGAILLDLEGKILFCNHAFETLSGYAAAELIGSRSEALLTTPEEEDLRAFMPQVLRQETVRNDWQLLRPDGRSVAVFSSFHVLNDPKTRHQYVLGIVRDITDRVASEQALAWEKKYFKFFVESMPHVMGVMDAQKRIVFLNRAGRELISLSPEAEHNGLQQWLSFIHPDDRANAFAKLSSLYRNQPIADFRIRIFDVRRQAYGWYQIRSVPQLDDEGKIAVYFGIATDIHELVTTQQELERQQRFYRSMVESQNLFFVQMDGQGRFTYANPAFVASFYPAQGVLRQDIAALVHAEDQEACTAVVQRVIDQPAQSHAAVIRHRLPSGNWAYVEWEVIGLLDEAEQVQRLQAVGRDISEKYRLEEERAMLALIVEQTDYQVVIASRDHRIAWSNSAFTHATGFELDELKGKPISEVFVGPMTGAATRQRMQQALTSYEPLSMELLKHDRYGKPYWAELTVQPVRDVSGEVTYVFSIERDITQRKVQSLELERTAQEITQRNERLNEFAYMISHNVRGPLANLKGMGEMLQAEIEANESNETLLGYFQTAIDRLENVIEDMQRLLDEEKEEEAQQAVSLMEIFHYVSDQLTLDIEAVSVQWEIDFQEAPYLWAPWTYLHNIFYNLISNAIKYRDPDRQLYIGVRSMPQSGEVKIEIADNGRGMDLSAVRDRLFQQGERFHSDVPGTGNGLFLVQQQVKRLQGRIEVKSTPEVGTTFLLYFPGRAGSPLPATEPQA